MAQDEMNKLDQKNKKEGLGRALQDIQCFRKL